MLTARNDSRLTLRSQHELAALASMVVASLPFPPLPVVALQGTDGEDGVASSFDLLQTAVMNEQLMNRAGRAAADIAQSKAAMLARLQQDMAALHARADKARNAFLELHWLQQAYALYCSAFREYLLRHYPTATQDLRFYPLEAVAADSVLIQQGCSHWKAACQLAGDDSRAIAARVRSRPRDALLKQYKRIC
jgi:hypothetical protein